MFRFVRSDILKADVEALVNVVNTVGVMGKGIALQFSRAYQEIVKPYQAACSCDRIGCLTCPYDSYPLL